MTAPSERSRFFATASRGTEEVLAQELRELGIDPVVADRGGVRFGRSLADGYRACLWSRVASRVLMPLARFEASAADDLYQGVRRVEWTEHLGPERTLAVAVAGAVSPIGPSHFVALKAKDAIVDAVRSRVGARPSIDKRRPDVRVHLHLRGEHVTVSLDLAGRGLHHRGLDRKGAQAPLRENLAAALLRIAGWPALSDDAPLFDPMCGSGTLLIEAAAMALDVAPGLARHREGFEGWRGHDDRLWARLRAEARERARAGRRRSPRIAGADAAGPVLRAAAERISRAGFARHVRTERADLHRASPPFGDPGIVVTNPPYGARLGEPAELGALYERLGDVLRRRFPGWTAWILSGSRALDKRIGLRPASRTIVFNGPIECRFLEVPISTKPVVGASGPGWRRPREEARGFARRLRANERRLRAWREREGIEAYRIYDADVPTYNVAVDRYARFVRVEEGPRPRKVSAADAEQRLQDVLRVIPEVLDVEPAHVVLRQQGRGPGRPFEVSEGDLRYRVDLSADPDGGLPLDERGLRHFVRDRAAGRDVLLLPAGTCSLAVAAAAGGARRTTGVERSRQKLEWGQVNLALNGLEGLRSRLRTALPSREAGRYDLIVRRVTEERPDAPADLDRLLAPGGEIVVVTRLKDVGVDELACEGMELREITEQITPPDFARRPRLRAWLLSRRCSG